MSGVWDSFPSTSGAGGPTEQGQSLVAPETGGETESDFESVPFLPVDMEHHFLMRL
ncbi:unnamed protein product, partial [Gadus morhua 'NCC']